MLKTRLDPRIPIDMSDAGTLGLHAHARTETSVLRLGVYKLPVAEVAVIRTIIQLYANDGAFPWTLVNAPPYDALLVDGTAAETERCEVARMAGAVLALTRMNSDERPDTLARPIRADRLQRWLNSTERALRQAQPTEVAAGDQAAPKIEVFDSARFMLRRWPSSLLLRNDLDKVRLASLLSRRAMKAIELADISGLPLSQCVTFLQLLRAAGTLELHVTPAATAQVEPPGSGEFFAAPNRRSYVRSLVNGIRRRLGLRMP
ncbi:hypothetical protein [Variovorax sp. YR566]|uniref:hypothetical protein n=1 Tax=Variovorax sp. YR566 TaxID=3450237 RepID=UPI003F7D6EE8